jgi:hypothetical protein
VRLAGPLGEREAPDAGFYLTERLVMLLAEETLGRVKPIDRQDDRGLRAYWTQRSRRGWEGILKLVGAIVNMALGGSDSGSRWPTSPAGLDAPRSRFRRASTPPTSSSATP